MSCRRRRGYRRFSTSAYRLLGDFEVAITGGVWVATGVYPVQKRPNSIGANVIVGTIEFRATCDSESVYTKATGYQLCCVIKQADCRSRCLTG